MALQRPITKAWACHSCQQWILRSFITAVGGTQVLQTRRPNLQQRPFSIAQKRRIESRERVLPLQDEDEHPLNEINSEYTSPPTANDPPSQPSKQQPTNTLPWYLHHAPPIQRPDNPLLARQQLPTLPPHSPPILQPLLEHLSTTLGINDLILLDLRTLDPPPALGANLLMLVGTARSEKHLHTTADRLCRFLRSEYNLRPHADGLLGRNELKIKLKRRAKRSRLLSAVGAKATAQTEVEDGIRTGWVCVNVGRVEGGEVPGIVGERERRMEKVVGFGPSESGCSVVVQLMTEEKRGEVDLETLWNEHLVKASRKRQGEGVMGGEEGGGVQTEPADGGREATSTFQQESPPAVSNYYQFGSTSNQFAGQQVRAYHTSSQRMQATTRSQRTNAKSPPPARTAPSKEIQTTASTADKLATLLAELHSMPPRQARRALGSNPLGASAHLNLDTNIPTPQEQDDVPAEDTPFLRTFYTTMPTYPGPEHWHHHIALLAHARRLGIHEIHSTTLIAQLTNMQIAGLVPEERTFTLVIEAALAPMGRMAGYDGVEQTPTTGKLYNVLAVLEDMEACGYDAVQPSILVSLYQACVGPADTKVAVNFDSIVTQLSLSRLRRLTREGDWATFRQTWRSYPQRFLPRTAAMYAVLFSAIGEGQMADVREAAEVLRMALEEMGSEQPPVRVEGSAELASAVARALEFVEPRLRGSRREVAGDVVGEGLDREWVRWYERCWGVREGV